MKFFLVTLLVTSMVFLTSVESAPPKRTSAPFDLNYAPQNPNPQFTPRYDSENRYLGIEYGEEEIPPVLLKAGCGLYNWDNELVGVFDGTAFYDRAEGSPGRMVVYPKNGFYASYEGTKKVAIFEDVWHPAPEEKAPREKTLSPPRNHPDNRIMTRSRTRAATVAALSGEEPSRAGPSRAGPSGEEPSSAGPSRVGPIRAGPSGEGPVSVGPSRAGPIRAGPIKAGPTRAGPIGEGSSRARPGRAGQRRPGPSGEQN